MGNCKCDICGKDINEDDELYFTFYSRLNCLTRKHQAFVCYDCGRKEPIKMDWLRKSTTVQGLRDMYCIDGVVRTKEINYERKI